MYATLAFAGCIAISASSFGQVDREWTFGVDGELPSADRDVTYLSAAGIPEDEDVTLVNYPKKKGQCGWRPIPARSW